MQPNLLWASTILAGSLFLAPTTALARTSDATSLFPTVHTGQALLSNDGTFETARRGRGRGRGGDRDRSGDPDDDRIHKDDRNDRNDSGSGRDRPRIPGGSGCDDPDDIIEHPECRI